MKQVSLFISSFKRIAGLLIVFLLVIWGYNIFSYLVVYEDDWSRIMWHNYYKEDKNIDNLFLGSSHVYCSVDPSILCEINGENNFNLASPGMPMDGAYYSLMEVDKDHDIKRVYLETWYNLFYRELKNDSVTTWKNTDYMKWSSNKMDYIFDAITKEELFNTFFPLLRFKHKITDFDYIMDIVEEKEKEDYKNYVTKTENDRGILEYRENGYRYTTQKFLEEEFSYKQRLLLDNKNIHHSPKEYLEKIVSYCEENGIELVLFSAPTTELDIYSTIGYDKYVEEITTFAMENNLVYYDFNLCKDEMLFMNAYDHFCDDNHLNYEGAKLFTSFLGKIMEQSYEENEEYFYDSWVEKQQSRKEQVYGIIHFNTEALERYEYTSMIASNRTGGLEYKIQLEPTNGEEVLLQDFSEFKFFDIPEYEHGICVIEVRKTGEEDIIQNLRIRY